MNVLEKEYNPLAAGNTPIVCVVSVGELKSLALRNGWGKKRIGSMEKLLELFLMVDIYAESILEMYAEIDAYSQNKLADKPLRATARNMGKNDIWIAAVTSILGAKLITTDKDFDHLNDVYFEVIKPISS